MARQENQTKFTIDQKVMVPVSEFPGVIKSISIRRNPSNGYNDSNTVYNYYMVRIQLQAIGKPEFVTVTIEYEESQLKAA